MILNILKQINWIDILVIIVLVRICYTALKSGFPAEMFKLLGTAAAIYTSLHYYTLFSDSLRRRFGLENIPLEFLDALCLALLVVAAYLVFVVLRLAFTHLIKMEAVPLLNKWGALVLGMVRAVLFSGLLMFIFFTSSIAYLQNSTRESYFSAYFFKVAPTTYRGLWNNLISKFSPREKFNPTVLEVEERFNP